MALYPPNDPLPEYKPARQDPRDNPLPPEPPDWLKPYLPPSPPPIELDPPYDPPPPFWQPVPPRQQNRRRRALRREPSGSVAGLGSAGG